MFEFQLIVNHKDFTDEFSVFREVSTDCLFVSHREGCLSGSFSGGLTQMLDPSTGKPLTYANWCEKYKDKKTRE